MSGFSDQTVKPFKPPFWLRPTMVQTGLASLKMRKRGEHPMEGGAVEMIFDCGRDEKDRPVRLMGSHSRHPHHKALVVFLHGWEGSQDSTYVMSCARQLYDQGCSIFRLNYRDHGDTHHLNEDIFLATRFDEVFAGVSHATELGEGVPVYIVGFSLGGNFALRVARATKKQALYPELHDFTDALSRDTIMEMSQDILPKYSGYPDLETYFTAYRIWPKDLTDCDVPVSIIMANDDPVVPASHLDELSVSDACNVIRLDHGGHNGFFQSLLGPTWYDDYIKDQISGDLK